MLTALRLLSSPFSPCRYYDVWASLNLAVVNAQMAWYFAIFIGTISLSKINVTTISAKDINLSINEAKRVQSQTEPNSAD